MQWPSLYTCTDAKQLNTLNVSALLQPTALELISLKLTSPDNNAPKKQSLCIAQLPDQKAFVIVFLLLKSQNMKGGSLLHHPI